MRIVTDIFYIIIFTTVIGSVFTVTALLLNRVLGIVLPLWFGVLGMLLYVFPILAPGLFLVSPEVQIWVEGYKIACIVWSGGIISLILCNLFRTVFAHRAISSYLICGDERIQGICVRCAETAGLKKIPEIYSGTLKDPACVTGILHPVIVINEKILSQLTETDLMAVLGHEMTHLKRGHMILGKIFDWICVLNWFNPLAWIARKEFDALCETDCDKNALSALKGKVSDKEYALTMLRLLEVSTVGSRTGGSGLSATGFLFTRQRIVQVMHRQSRLRSIVSLIVLIVTAAAVICFSIKISQGYFYPYPAYYAGTEYR